MEIILEIPTEQHETEANRFNEEFFNNQEKVIHGSALFDQMNYKEWLIRTREDSNIETVHKDWVVTTTFFGVRQSDGRIIGIISIRHNLDNEFLANYGGHIGYSVRPSERRKGYATQMLNLALEYAETIDLDKVMLSCYNDNIGSNKTIIKCGGILKDSKIHDQKMLYIYWINL